MGVIRTQTIKGTFFTYIGAGLGLVTNLFFLAEYFTPEQIGLLNILIAYSLLFAQFANLGFDNVTLRLFPYFRNDTNKHNGYLFIMLTVLTIGSILSLFIYFVLQPIILNNAVKAGNLFSQYAFYIFPLIVVTLFFNSFDAYSRVLYRSVRGTFLKEFLQRVLIVIAILLYIVNVFDFEFFVFLYVVCLSIPTLILLWLIARDRQLNFKPKPEFITKDLRKSMISVSFFGIITMFSNSLMISIDKIMLEDMLGLSIVGIYSITYYFGTIITMPSRALAKISSTVVSEAWKNNDVKTVKDVYYKSCLNQMIFSALLFVGIWANIENVFNILPEQYMVGKYVIFWVCLGSFIDMSTGVNNTVMATSKYYKTQSLFTAFFVVIVVLTNLIFIPLYGITGAGVANAVSLFSYNLMRWIFLWGKFGMQPFNYKYLLILLFSVLAYLSVYFIPDIKPFWIDILVRSAVIFVVFSAFIYFTRLSEDINSRVNVYLQWIGIKKIN